MAGELAQDHATRPTTQPYCNSTSDLEVDSAMLWPRPLSELALVNEPFSNQLNWLVTAKRVWNFQEGKRQKGCGKCSREPDTMPPTGSGLASLDELRVRLSRRCTATKNSPQTPSLILRSHSTAG